MEAPALHAWVRDDLAKLGQVGIIATPAEVVWLSELAKAAHQSPGRELPFCLASPLKVCGTTLYPFHLRARYWFATWRDVFEGDALMQDGLYQFAHAHSKPGDKSLVDLATADEVSDAVKVWLRTREYDSLHFPAINAALFAMDQDGEEEVPAVKERAEAPVFVTLEERVANLCDLFPGTTPDYWMYDLSAVEAMKLAAAKCAADGDGVWATSALRTRRIASYMNAVQWIAKRGLAANG